jgi:MFS family permease
MLIFFSFFQQLAMFIAALDVTIVSTAIPTICAELHSAAGYVWIGTSFLLANAAAGPIWASLSDIWGRKPILLAAVALFFLSSIICASSRNIEMLIAGRSFQGMASAGIMQLVMICISDLFSQRKQALLFGLTESMWALAGGE